MESVALRLQTQTLEQIAAKGSCVITGRRADQVLKNNHHVLSVFTTASAQNRVRSIAGTGILGIEGAGDLILEAVNYSQK